MLVERELKPSHMVMVDDVPDGLAVAGLRKPDDCLRSGNMKNE